MNLSQSNKYDTPVYKKDQPDDTYKFQPLPPPKGAYPYRLDIKKVLPEGVDDKMIFNMVGDTGSVRNPDFQRLVAGEMLKQFIPGEVSEDEPKFLYHLGDVVYNFGEADRYYDQFFGPYEKYPAPIVAIAGNHDSDVNPDSKSPYHSLDPFVTVFCDNEPREIPFSGGVSRKSMVQPNVYWTLESPVATIIGLHSNVPKYGIITAEQRQWFLNELIHADKQRPDKALIVCLHHAPYTADVNHSSSIPMIEFLESAFEETGVRPDIVFSGHVHNYQRLEKRYQDGGVVTYIVAGGGGYDELHAIADRDDDRFSNDNPLFNDVKLLRYCSDKHGFMTIIVERRKDGLFLTGKYYSIPHEQKAIPDKRSDLADEFVLKIS